LGPVLAVRVVIVALDLGHQQGLTTTLMEEQAYLDNKGKRNVSFSHKVTKGIHRKLMLSLAVGLTSPGTVFLVSFYDDDMSPFSF
jgi:hypothetical protein